MMEKSLEHEKPVREPLTQRFETSVDLETEWPGSEREALEALRRYYPSAGHPPGCDVADDVSDSRLRRILNEKEMVQRLRTHGLIFPGGKLTAKGLRLGVAWLGVLNDPQTWNRKLEKVPEQEFPVHNIPSIAVETSLPPKTGLPVLDPDALDPVRGGGPTTGYLLKNDVETGARDGGPTRISKKKRSIRKPPLREEEVHLSQDISVVDGMKTTEAPKNSNPQQPASRNETALAAPIPRPKSHGFDESLVTLYSPQSYEAEQFRMLKACILYPPTGDPPRSLLITSVNQEDGKSFVAANLAISMAQNLNHPVLLIDCDLRKPTIHRLFGLEDVPGLSEYLCRTQVVQSLFQKTDVDRLYLLPAGRTPQNPAELLASARMAALMEELTLRYRDSLILLDSPPVNTTAEPSVLARLVSKVLLVVKYGKTRRNELQMVMDKLGKDKFIGSVINRYEHSFREYDEYRKFPGYARTPIVETESALVLRSASNSSGGDPF